MLRRHLAVRQPIIRSSILALLALVLVSLALLACGGQAVPTSPPAPTGLPVEGPAVTQVPVEGPAPTAQPQLPATPDPSIVLPTFTPGPKVLSGNRLLYVRSGQLWIANADGSDRQPLLGEDAPQVYSPPRDPGRAWVSPSGQKVAYLGGSEGSLWIVNVDGSDNHQVSEGLLPAPGTGTEKDIENVIRRLYGQELAWSPDEKRVAFLGAPGFPIDLYIARVDGAELVQVTDDELNDTEPAWSPDGRYLAYTSVDERFANEYVYFVTADGKQVSQVDTQSALEQTGAEYKVLAGVQGVTWLDDTSLFFYPLSARGSLGIWRATVPSGDVSVIFSEPIGEPAWSPEARSWVFPLAGQPGKLWILGEGDSAARLLAENAYAPIWSPDGQWVVYSAETEETVAGWDIRVVNPDGTDDRLLTRAANLIGREPPEPGPEGKRYWSADGKSLFYTAVGASYGSPGPDLENWWQVSLAGGEPRPVTDLQRVFYLQQPEPSPDGKSYAFVGFSYLDKVLRVWTFGSTGGNVKQVDVNARWFHWLP